MRARDARGWYHAGGSFTATTATLGTSALAVLIGFALPLPNHCANRFICSG